MDSYVEVPQFRSPSAPGVLDTLSAQVRRACLCLATETGEDPCALSFQPGLLASPVRVAADLFNLAHVGFYDVAYVGGGLRWVVAVSQSYQDPECPDVTYCFLSDGGVSWCEWHRGGRVIKRVRL